MINEQPRLTDLAPDFVERVRAGKQEERLVGTADLPNFFRQAFGPGWALDGGSDLASLTLACYTKLVTR